MPFHIHSSMSSGGLSNFAKRVGRKWELVALRCVKRMQRGRGCRARTVVVVPLLGMGDVRDWVSWGDEHRRNISIASFMMMVREPTRLSTLQLFSMSHCTASIWILLALQLVWGEGRSVGGSGMHTVHALGDDGQESGGGVGGWEALVAKEEADVPLLIGFMAREGRARWAVSGPGERWWRLCYLSLLIKPFWNVCTLELLGVEDVISDSFVWCTMMSALVPLWRRRAFHWQRWLVLQSGKAHT